MSLLHPVRGSGGAGEPRPEAAGTTRYLVIIGHGKTGSTALQRCLAASRDILAEAGIAYPSAPGEEHSGNGRELLTRESFETLAPRVLYCNEHIWRQIADLPDAERRLAALGPPRMLLFLRDPLEHAASGWRQNVQKGRAGPQDIDAHFEAYDLPARMRALISRLDALGADLTIRNYSKVRADPVAEVEAWLGVRGLRRCGRANRSLTAGEIAMLDALAEAQVDAPGLADELVRELPDIAEPLAGPAPEVQRRLLERLAADIEWIGARAGPHGYGTALLPEFDDGALQLTRAQVAVLARHLACPRRSAAAPLRGRIGQVAQALVRGRRS